MPDLNDMPPEILMTIFSFLPSKDLKPSRLVNKNLEECATDEISDKNRLIKLSNQNLIDLHRISNRMVQRRVEKQFYRYPFIRTSPITDRHNKGPLIGTTREPKPL